MQGPRSSQPEGIPVERVVGGFLALVLSLWGGASGEQGRERSDTPADRYQALLKEYQVASSSGRVLSDAQRMEFVGRTFRRRNLLALEFVELAERFPNDPVAVDALIQAVWQVNTTPWPAELVGREEARSRAFALLERDHIRSKRLGPVCERISSGFCKEYETFLHAV